jgi:hypothetical protein
MYTMGPLPNRRRVPLSNRRRVPLSNRRRAPLSNRRRVPLTNRRRAPLSNRRRVPLPDRRRVPLCCYCWCWCCCCCCCGVVVNSVDHVEDGVFYRSLYRPYVVVVFCCWRLGHRQGRHFRLLVAWSSTGSSLSALGGHIPVRAVNSRVLTA